jgi:hypothetical protein
MGAAHQLSNASGSIRSNVWLSVLSPTQGQGMPCFDEGPLRSDGVLVHRSIANPQRSITARKSSQPTFDHLSALPLAGYASGGRNEAQNAVILNPQKWSIGTQ